MRARRLAAVAVLLLAAGCAHAGSRNGSGSVASRAEAWSTELDWPFSLGVRGRDVVVTVSGNRVVALDTTTGREVGARR